MIDKLDLVAYVDRAYRRIKNALTIVDDCYLWMFIDGIFSSLLCVFVFVFIF